MTACGTLRGNARGGPALGLVGRDVPAERRAPAHRVAGRRAGGHRRRVRRARCGREGQDGWRPLPGRRPRGRRRLSGDQPGGRCELDEGSPLAIETARRLACDASLVQLLERTVSHDGSRARRTIPPALRRRSTRATAAAVSRAVGRGGTSTRTTSSTGRTAAPPTSTTWSTCADMTTACCTRADIASRGRRSGRLRFTVGTGGRSRTARRGREAARGAACRRRAGPTRARRSRTTRSTSSSPSMPCSSSARVTTG